MKTRTELIISLQNEVDLCFEAKKTRDNDGPPYSDKQTGLSAVVELFQARKLQSSHKTTVFRVVSLKANPQTIL